MSSETCIMYLLRHGATEVNTANPPRLQGRGTNLGLSDVGRRQAELTAALLAKRQIEAVYSSPLLRARQTAQLIAAPHGCDVQTVNDLSEVHVGTWEGRAWVDIAQSEPQAYALFMEDPGRNAYAGGESFQHVLDRALPAMQRLMEENLGRQIVVVAHNIVNRSCLSALLEIPLARARSIDQQNCCINIVRLKDGAMQLRTLNAAFHLDEPSVERTSKSVRDSQPS